MLYPRHAAHRLLVLPLLFALGAPAPAAAPTAIFGFGLPQAEKQRDLEERFLAVPDRKRLEHHLRILTAVPHPAGSAADRRTAEYVAHHFRAAGLDTEIREYKVWMNTPGEISVTAKSSGAVVLEGPRAERVEGDPYQNSAGVPVPFSGFSPSGDVEAHVVYANYGRREDFEELERQHVDVRGKIVLIRYGRIFRGVKVKLAEERGAAGVILYTDPQDDGYRRGKTYPDGPWRPSSAVQFGSVKYGFEAPGDPTTPGVASLPDLPESERLDPERSGTLPGIPVTPLSAADAQPILQHLGGREAPRGWGGALPVVYRLGPGPVTVRLRIRQDYGYRSIWNVIGRVRGSDFPDDWVIAGNHRDAWVYGAVDPSSGTAAMLETVAGIGELLRSGWKPRRTIIFASWDAEEQSLIGSTEWAEEHAQELSRAVAYFNLDTGGIGPDFRAAALPSLRRFLAEITRAVPSPDGGTVFDNWRNEGSEEVGGESASFSDAPVSNLGSGSDYTPFIHVAGVPATDVRSSGPYGVYHSVFDNFAWFRKFADPEFAYSQQMARLFGLEVLRMADAGALPYDYATYGEEISRYLLRLRRRSRNELGAGAPSFDNALAAAGRLAKAGRRIADAQHSPPADSQALNRALRQAESALLLPEGLPGRPFYRHAIFAPSRDSGYGAAVLPGVSEAVDDGDRKRAAQQLQALTRALNRAAGELESALE